MASQMQHLTKCLIALLIAIPQPVSGFIPTEQPSTSATSFDSSSEAPDMENIKSELLELGVDIDEADALIEKLKEGFPWYSMTKDTPLREEPIYGSSTGMKLTYADGSVAIVTVESPKPVHSDNASSLGLQGCTEKHSSGIKYATNCEVAYNGVSFRYGFKADYSYGPSSASIKARPGTQYGYVVGGSWSFEGITSTSRTVRGNFSLTFGPYLGKSFWVQGNVNNNGAWTTYG